ncbi:hypothetical protein Rhopal_004937-T1 [Rhodotorula paludigena]|uniref:Uncharacterized protein n=1 Tax=Rhodotorula paludigena TaxID=86838 RepID=A0AAV5GS99_9BASI|nr:hypothetical protein Rhopal_004937-T1 [Rhodotorula paludigena]
MGNSKIDVKCCTWSSHNEPVVGAASIACMSPFVPEGKGACKGRPTRFFELAPDTVLYEPKSKNAREWIEKHKEFAFMNRDKKTWDVMQKKKRVSKRASGTIEYDEGTEEADLSDEDPESYSRKLMTAMLDGAERARDEQEDVVVAYEAAVDAYREFKDAYDDLEDPDAPEALELVGGLGRALIVGRLTGVVFNDATLQGAYAFGFSLQRKRNRVAINALRQELADCHGTSSIVVPKELASVFGGVVSGLRSLKRCVK